jgi:hypothetical protein
MALYFGFEVFTAVTVKSAVFCDVSPCSPVEIYCRFGEHTLSIFSRQQTSPRSTNLLQIN